VDGAVAADNVVAERVEAINANNELRPAEGRS